MRLGELFKRGANSSGSEVYLATSLSDAGTIIKRVVDEKRVKSVYISRLPDKLRSEISGALASAGVMVNELCDEGLDESILREVAASDMGISILDAGIAETGTLILLDGNASRLVSSLPRIFIGILREESIIESFSELPSYMRGVFRADRMVFLITGPSGTSDIELDYVRGVHGPSEVHVIIIRGEWIG